jgi:hypothetical protein
MEWAKNFSCILMNLFKYWALLYRPLPISFSALQPEGRLLGDVEAALVRLPDAVVLHCVHVLDGQRVVVPSAAGVIKLHTVDKAN